MLGQVRLWYEAMGACRASFSSIEGFCSTTLRKSSGTVVLARQYCFSKQEALCAELSSDSGRCTHIMQRSTEIQAFRSHIPGFSEKRHSEKKNVVFQKSTSRPHGRFQIRHTPNSRGHARRVHHGHIASESRPLFTCRSSGLRLTNSFLLADGVDCVTSEEERIRQSKTRARACGHRKGL